MTQTQEFLKNLNLDVVHEILLQLGQVSSPQQRDHSLVQIALTCKSLCEPALDVLWRNQTTLMPLLNLLPGFTKVTVERKKISNVGGTTQPECTPFASRFWLPDWFSGPPLLPRLHTLATTAHSGLGASLPFLVPPTLRGVELNSDRGVREAMSFVAFLSAAGHSTHPAIEDLCLRGGFPAKILEVIPCFSSLRQLELCNIDENISQAALIAGLNTIPAGGMPALKSLTLRNVPIGESAADLRTISLPTLETLHISAGLDFIDGLVQKLIAPDLQSLKFTSAHAPGPPMASKHGKHTVFTALRWQLFMDTVASRWESTLHSVTLSAFEAFDFSPLYRLSLLRRFTLQIKDIAGATIDDSTVSVLASSWPRLEHLVLKVEESRGNLPSINCLVDLANSCPSLRYLEISLILSKNIYQAPATSAFHPLHTLRLPYPTIASQLDTLHMHRIGGIARGAATDVGKLVIDTRHTETAGRPGQQSHKLPSGTYCVSASNAKWFIARSALEFRFSLFNSGWGLDQVQHLTPLLLQNPVSPLLLSSSLKP
ncbi:hypothetical protein C8R46DRAFT_1190802 [Mycena filopes]|nr:hypothetical protein C8R46DRAFT_1190802 [Mycena filopes]